MYKAVFLDMDGTLLKSDHSVSEKTIQTIQTLTGKGIRVILVSARPLNAVLPTFGKIGLPDYDPIVTLNGSYIVEADKPIFQAMVDPQTTLEIAEEVRPFGATIAYYLQREWYSETSDKWTDYEQRIMDVKVKVGPIAAFVKDWTARKVGPNKMMVMSEAGNIAKIQAHLKDIYNGALNIYPSKPTYLEVMESSGSKAKAIKFISERFGLAPTEIIAMGDNYNDYEMIRFAGMGVAMGNAPEEIKAAADYITDTNNNDGVRLALEKFFGLA